MAVRNRTMACPCCGAALALTAGDPGVPDSEPINVIAERFMLEASYLHSADQLRLRQAEDVAEDIVSGQVVLAKASR